MHTFTPIASADEIADASSWVNVGFDYSKAEYESFFKTLGEAIALWADVERRVQAIFYSALQSGEYHAVTEVFLSPDGFRTKLKMTDAALKNSKSLKIDLADWKDVKTFTAKISRSRNDLAHHQVFYDHHAPTNRHFFLARGGAEGVASRKHQAELEIIKANFVLASERLSQFWLSLSLQPSPSTPK